MVRTPIQIRFSDFDAFRHVNNAVYSSYFEIGRVTWMHEVLGLGPGSRLEDIPFILARVEIDMLRPIDYAMQAEVITLVSRIGRSSWDFTAFLRDPENGRLYARAKTVQVAYDYGAASTVAIPDGLRAQLEELLSADTAHAADYDTVNK